MRIVRYLLILVALLTNGCSRPVATDNELSDKGYLRAIQLSNEGRESEALVQFLGVIHRHETAPRSHLCAGRIYLETYNDPIYAIYHFREFLLQGNDDREKTIVSQLINTAKKKFIKDLPGNNSVVDSRMEIMEVAKQLREENVGLRRMIKELQDHCNMLESKKASLYRAVESGTRPANSGIRHHVVQPGDTLSTISRKYYGSSTFWKKIFEANQDKIPYPNVLTVGQEIIIP